MDNQEYAIPENSAISAVLSLDWILGLCKIVYIPHNVCIFISITLCVSLHLFYEILTPIL